MMGDLERLLTPLPLSDGTNLPRLLPGPMQGVMSADLCQVMTEFDLISAWISPFIRVSTNVPGLPRLQTALAPYAQRSTIAQLMGTNSELIAKTAARVLRLPFVHGIELNCACPSKTVLRKGSGAALLATPEWIPKTVDAVRRETDGKPVGVKVRAGTDSPNAIPKIMRAVAEADPDWCVMHYRTAEEFYRPIKDGWRRFDRAKPMIPDIPLLGSGDLFTVEDCLTLARKHPVDGMTPARGLMQNPWLIRTVEARLSGVKQDEGTVKDLLIRLAEVGQDNPSWKPGGLLEIAGMAWGRESDQFNALVGENTALGMIGELQALH